MASFKDALFDESDPDYAPGIMYRGRWPIWKATPKFVAAGYVVRYVKLAEGTRDDGLHRERAAKCRELTREMLQWADGHEASRPKAHTIKWLIGRYKTDEGSDYHRIKANTRKDYDHHLAYWEDRIGDREIGFLTFEEVRRVEGAMLRNGQTLDFIHRKFTMLRAIIKHGKMIRAANAREVKETLSEMTFKMPPKRDVAATRMQVLRVVVKARQAGYHHFATGILLQYEFALRAVDVRGQWLPASGEGGIVNNGRRWQDGLTWEMFDGKGFTKVISKTKDSLPEPIYFPLDDLPRLREMILALTEARVGPVILSSTGLPYDKRTWSGLWRRFAREGRVPDHVRCMDLRAGAISEADSKGASREALSQAAQHTQMTTTARYVRNRSKAVAQVIDIRQRRN